MPELLQMKMFVSTSELGSLAAAARKFGISSAAVSKQLTNLEAELGLQLLIRSTRHIELTEVGKSYFNQCQRILEEAEEASALIAQIKAIPSGCLNVLSGRYFAVSYIVPHIKEFLQKYPQIEINLELAERIPDLSVEPIDVLIGMSISATGDAIQRRIAETSYAICASPQYLKQFGKPKKPSDLKNHRYITHSMRKPDDELIFRNKVIKLSPFIRVNDSQTMLKLALDNLGIVKLHHYVVKECIEKGKLIELFTSYKEPPIPIYVAYPQRRYLPSKTRCFIDFFVKKIDET